MCNLRVPLPARSQRDAEALRFGDFGRSECGIWKLGEPAGLPLRLVALLGVSQQLGRSQQGAEGSCKELP